MDADVEKPAAYRLSDCVVRNASTEAESAGDETFVLDLDSGRYFNLGTVGGFIWQRLDGRRELGEVAAEVAEVFEVSVDEAAGDLLEFVEMLAGLGLVEDAVEG